MSIFPFRRSDESDLAARLAELERAHGELARELETTRASADGQIELLWVLACPLWLREGIDHAMNTGWLVGRAPEAIVFERPDGDEHTFRIPMPLPGDPGAADRLRQDLQMRLRSFAHA